MALIRQTTMRMLKSTNVTTTQVRNFITLSPTLLEETATSSQKINTDFAAALSRAVAQQKGQNSEKSRQRRVSSQSSDNNRSRSEGSDNRRSTRPSLSKKRTGQDLVRTPVKDGSPLARVQKNVAPKTDWNSNTSDSVPFSRVPYSVPKVDLKTLKENATKQNTPKTWRPLREATRLLRMVPTARGNWVQGGEVDPTPVATEGISQGAEPLKLAQRDVKAGADQNIVSIAKEAREARIQAAKETVGGDYDRFLSNVFLSGSKDGLAKDVAQAVASNDDLAPTHKAFTADSIQQILNKK